MRGYSDLQSIPALRTSPFPLEISCIFSASSESDIKTVIYQRTSVISMKITLQGESYK